MTVKKSGKELLHGVTGMIDTGFTAVMVRASQNDHPIGQAHAPSTAMRATWSSMFPRDNFAIPVIVGTLWLRQDDHAQHACLPPRQRRRGERLSAYIFC